ncbi:YesL family protein [Domibacillus enclensis]|uniref:Uncharacterized membrane protein YesL n=1 Tax=Domibacillus enclensis TaxID=1017273 RepID=A0A1N6VAB1_9BACI|nr:DUF624 domain-containing protein [Domibacillus enclensis]OXS78732.1 hypothetical protein B1B05_09110 [Domibacillus enclensis]SIQ74659.1 Uncharacterized membrane protein YesL [Domibacillus enclensis]
MGQLFQLEGPLFKLLSRAVDLVLLNILFLLFSLPLLTIGASTTALYSVLLKVIRNEDETIVKSFFISFRNNFKQGTMVWLVVSVAGVLLLANFGLLGKANGLPMILWTSVLIVFSFVYICTSLFAFAYMARYEDTIKKVLINSMIMGISHFPYLILLIFFNVFPLWIAFSSPAGLLTGLYFGTFGGFALVGLMNSIIFRKIFMKYES